jgi:sugar lactone lactonase YvrE
MSPRQAARDFESSKGENMSSKNERKSLFLRLITTVTLAFLCLGTWATAKSGGFPDWIPLPGVVARGVAVDKVGNVYVTVTSGTPEQIQLRKFAPDGEELFSKDIGLGTIGGLMAAADGDLYIAVAAGYNRGVYRMDSEGELELLPGSEKIFFANGLAFDDVGNLYVTESVSLVSFTSSGKPSGPGSIWRIPREGEAELCLRDPLLQGTGPMNQPVFYGANGIAYYHGNLYVTNTEKGTIVRIPVWPDGSVGSPELWTTLANVPESPAAGTFPAWGDGLALDVFGNLYVVVLSQSAIVRINLSDKSQETVAVYGAPATSPLNAPLDVPASIFFGTGKGERMNIFVTNQGVGKLYFPDLPWAGPGLVKIEVGVPGRPLH